MDYDDYIFDNDDNDDDDYDNYGDYDNDDDDYDNDNEYIIMMINGDLHVLYVFSKAF